MTITATVIADSISEQGIRLTTFQLRYPRFIHAELMTHRMFSRNASSSRAIPVERMIEDLRRNPAMPVFWGSNKPGMQAGAELPEAEIDLMKIDWFDAMHGAIKIAENMVAAGLHKQIANRILEPWAHINVVVTATDYANFYALRRHPDAQPEIKVLADAMWWTQQQSVPELLQPDEWHLPYADGEDVDLTSSEAIKIAKKVSVARCARVSYLTHDGRQTTIEEDVALYDRLVGSMPLHASPAEHQATPDNQWANGDWVNPHQQANLTGWRQLRKMLPGEYTKG